MRQWTTASVVVTLIAASVSCNIVSAIAGYFGEPIRSSDADWHAFTVGLRQFSRVWQTADGVGLEFNERSCMACHAVPMPGGAGLAKGTFVLVSAQVHDDFGGHVFRRLQRTSDGIVERSPPDVFQRRKTPSLFGLGLLETVPREELIKARPGPDNLIGRPGGKDGQFGRFGRKAGIPDLEHFVRLAFAVELGFGSKALPGATDPALEAAIDQVTTFVRMLRPPPKRDRELAREQTGRELFQQIGCAQCHWPTLSAKYVLGSTMVEEQISPYTDLLLHDMGGALSDGISDGNATGSDFRTPPLWGLSSFGPPYLHDGRASNLTQAIAEHNGEARNTRLRWEALTDEERLTLLRFLQAL